MSCQGCLNQVIQPSTPEEDLLKPYRSIGAFGKKQISEAELGLLILPQSDNLKDLPVGLPGLVVLPLPWKHQTQIKRDHFRLNFPSY